MWFNYFYESLSYVGELQYIKEEESLYYEPWIKNDFSIMLGAAYTDLNALSETGEVVQLSGLNPKKLWIEKTLLFPDARKGKLLFKSEQPLLRGTGVDYATNWKTFYDPLANCICIGDAMITPECDCVEFCNGVVAVLKKKELLSVWARIKFV